MDVEKQKHLFTVSGSANWDTTMDTSHKFLRKLKRNLLYDTVITHMDIYPKDSLSYYRDTYTPMLTAALFTTAGK